MLIIITLIAMIMMTLMMMVMVKLNIEISVIISHRWVITTARCVDGEKAPNVQVAQSNQIQSNQMWRWPNPIKSNQIKSNQSNPIKCAGRPIQPNIQPYSKGVFVKSDSKVLLGDFDLTKPAPAEAQRQKVLDWNHDVHPF